MSQSPSCALGPIEQHVEHGADAGLLPDRDPEQQHDDADEVGEQPERQAGLLREALGEHVPRRDADAGAHHQRDRDAVEEQADEQLRDAARPRARRRRGPIRTCGYPTRELDFSQDANSARVAVVTSLSARALGTLIQNWRTSGNGPAYAALADRIRLLVLDGRLAARHPPARRARARRPPRAQPHHGLRRLRRPARVAATSTACAARAASCACPRAEPPPCPTRSARPRLPRLQQGDPARRPRGRRRGRAGVRPAAELPRRVGLRPARAARAAAGARRPLHRARPADRRRRGHDHDRRPARDRRCSPAPCCRAATARSSRRRATRTRSRR